MDFIGENPIPAFLESTELTFELESVDIYNNIIFPAQGNDYDFNPQKEAHYKVRKLAQENVDEGL